MHWSQFNPNFPYALAQYYLGRNRGFINLDGSLSITVFIKHENDPHITLDNNFIENAYLSKNLSQAGYSIQYENNKTLQPNGTQTININIKALPIKEQTMNQPQTSTQPLKNRIQIGNRNYKYKMTEKVIIFLQIENVNFEMLNQVSQFFQTDKINVGAYFIEDEESHNLLHKYFKLIIPIFDIKQNLNLL